MPRASVIAAMCAVAMPGIAVAQSQDPVAPVQPSIQQAFDAGQALLDKGRYAEAEAGFAAIEARLVASPRHPMRSLALAQMRRAQALIGVGDEGRATGLLLDALPGLDAPADVDLRAEALIALGDSEERALDLSAAATHYRAALALIPATDPTLQVSLRVRIGRTALFDDPAATAAELARNLPQAETVLAKNKQQLAQYLALYGRTLLNAHQYKPARKVLDRALTLSGGLTLDVNLFSRGVRGDAALAAQLDGDIERAIELTAYTGAARSDSAALSPPRDQQPPACGGPADLRADDLAVVQFTLGENGVVRAATPIYASRAGPMAIEFARAVRDWSWSPVRAAAVVPFFRTARVELRCTTRAERRSVNDLLWPEVERWMASLPGHGAYATARSRLSTKPPLAKLEALLHEQEDRVGTDAPGTLPILLDVARNSATDYVAALRDWERAERIARAASAPAAVLAWTGIQRASRIDPFARITSDVLRQRRRAALDRLAADPAIAVDPRARAAVLLVRSGFFAPKRGLAETASALQEVLATPVSALPEGDPIRQAAAIRLASVQAAAGERVAAEATFRTSGLAADQCALIDSDPVPVSKQGAPNDYPDLLLRLGFTGWSLTEFDILTDGSTRTPRTVIAYPPFLFSDNTTRMARAWRYRPTFRPDGVPSCGGYQMMVNFVMPERPR